MKKLLLVILVLVSPLQAEEIPLPKGISFRHICEEFLSDFSIEYQEKWSSGPLVGIELIYLQNKPLPLTGIKSVEYSLEKDGTERVQITLNEIGQRYIESVGTTPLVLAMIYDDRIFSLTRSTELGSAKKVLQFSGPFDYEVDPWTGPGGVNRLRPKTNPLIKKRRQKPTKSGSSRGETFFQRLFEGR